MTSKLTGTVALVAEIEEADGTALAVEADIADRTRPRPPSSRRSTGSAGWTFWSTNAGLMLLGPVVGAEVEQWDRMIAINNQGLLYTTHAALTHLLKAAEDDPRQVADIVNISSIAGRVAWNGYGVYNMTKFGVNGFTRPSDRRSPAATYAWVSSSPVAWQPSWVRTTPAQRVRRSTPSTPRPRSSPQKTSLMVLRTWSPGHGTPPSVSCGSCPPTKRDPASWVSDREPTANRGDLEVVPVYGLCQPPSFLARA